MIAVIGFDQLYARRNHIGGPIGAPIGRIGPICARDCAWPCRCADRPSQFLGMHMSTHAQNGFSNSPKQTACTLFHGHYFIDVISWIPMRRDSSAEVFSLAASPQIPLHTVQKNRSHLHNFAVYSHISFLLSLFVSLEKQFFLDHLDTPLVASCLTFLSSIYQVNHIICLLCLCTTQRDNQPVVPPPIRREERC
jgi:hypothetical protein